MKFFTCQLVFIPLISLSAESFNQVEFNTTEIKFIEEFNYGFDSFLNDINRRSAEQGDANAQYNLGNRYRKGEGVPQDDKEAVKWFRKSAEQGDASAQCNLGVMYYLGEGVPQDYKEAVR